MRERRALQVVVTVACLVPILTGLDGVLRGVVIVEGVQPNTAFPDEAGINTLTSAFVPAPYGGAAFHDNHVWIERGHIGAKSSEDA